MNRYLVGAGMIVATIAIVFVSKARADERIITAVMCDKEAELDAVWAIHESDNSIEFSAIMAQVKAKLGSDNCIPVTAKVDIMEVVKTVKANDGTMLDMVKVSVHEACQENVCFRFPNSNPAYMLLKAKESAPA